MSNSIQNFVINNIGTIVAILAAIGGIFKAIGYGTKQQVISNVCALVSDAEQLGGTSGLDKFNYVFDLAYTKLPKIFKIFLSENDIKMAIEFWLNKLQAFANQQAKDTSTKVIANNADLDTSIKTGTDNAIQTKLVTSPSNVNLDQVDSKDSQNTSNQINISTEDITHLINIANKLQNITQV